MTSDDHVLEIAIANELEEIVSAAEKIDAFCEEREISPEIAYAVNLSIDEILTNAISYGYDDDTEHDIEIVLSKNGEAITIEIADDGRPFDPLQDAPEMDAESALEERRVGGAGIALTKTMMTDLRYHRDDGRNHLIMVKDL